MNNQSLDAEVRDVRLPLNHGVVMDAGAIRHTSAGDAVIKLLNDVLATKLVGALRYRSHHFQARAIHLPVAAREFLAQANAELRHADLLAERILQLGGMPDFSPQQLVRRSEAGHVASYSLASMVREDLLAADILMGSYRGIIASLGDSDNTTRHMMEDILAIKENHADELSELLVTRYRVEPQVVEETSLPTLSPLLNIVLQTV